MNAILRKGFVRPIIKFHFAGGVIDTAPPTCFMHFNQNRSTRVANTFELTLLYVPGTFGETEATTMHQLLLSSVKQPVEYQYGYVTPGGDIHLQNELYVGMFNEYFEDIAEGYYTYKICGVSKCVELNTVEVNPEQFLSDKRKAGQKTPYKPSSLWKEFIETDMMNEYFKNYNIHIDTCDKFVSIGDFKISKGPLMEVLNGKRNADGSTTPGSWISLSVKPYDPLSSLTSQTLAGLAAAGTAAATSAAAKGAEALNSEKNQLAEPFVAFFDNVKEGGKNGTFYYVPKFSSSEVQSYTFEYGNSYLNSDVLSFNASINCVVAMASVAATQTTTSDIDIDGNGIGANYNMMQPNGYVPDSYSSISGFEESALLSQSTIADALIFPFEATMTVIGEVRNCKRLLDKINVTVTFNGVRHPGLSGRYVILDIVDDLSDSGFTTTFKLLRDYNGTADISDVKNHITSAKQEVATIVESAKDKDYAV